MVGNSSFLTAKYFSSYDRFYDFYYSSFIHDEDVSLSFFFLSLTLFSFVLFFYSLSLPFYWDWWAWLPTLCVLFLQVLNNLQLLSMLGPLTFVGHNAFNSFSFINYHFNILTHSVHSFFIYISLCSLSYPSVKAKHPSFFFILSTFSFFDLFVPMYLVSIYIFLFSHFQLSVSLFKSIGLYSRFYFY